jgi:hypothetical protein
MCDDFCCGKISQKCDMRRGHVKTQFSFKPKIGGISLIHNENHNREANCLMDDTYHLTLHSITKMGLRPLRNITKIALALQLYKSKHHCHHNQVVANLIAIS